jgi:hypothetical protein
MRSSRITIPALAWLTLCGVACDGPRAEQDAGGDAGSDADLEPDAEHEIDADEPLDAEADSDEETDFESGDDADVDPDPDQDQDTERDTESDQGDGERDGESGEDADSEDGGADPCEGGCVARTASDCTCAPTDPCGWIGDGVCDLACDDRPGEHLVDLDDCDLDLDGLHDELELVLALRYEPWLWLSPREEGFRDDRLPHFAVEPTGEGTLSLYYALSYFEDYGDPDLGGLSSHMGDTEFIVVEVSEVDWRVIRVFLSAHYLAWNDASGWFWPEQLSFEAGEDGSLHPVAYVAEWKHANYRTLALCDMGSLFADHCAEGSLEPVGIERGRNLGNPDAPLLDGITFEGNLESYWTSLPFCGWRVASVDEDARGGCSPAYAGYLSRWLEDDL